ncbi:NUDIX hydrolase [Pseudomonas rhodesiae]|uniref:NUDIX hydrolase n=1 Tax=Pseudomonas rhodesiae TaxID=76760 RepID=UPI0009E39376|nr:NUDIX hydrolase [Pseudomonas rhodesiae]
MSEPRIRQLAICIFHHQGKILVNSFHDPVKQQSLFRPLGGGVEFGERSIDAIAREIREELDQPIWNVRLLGTLESIFTYLGKPGHEVVQVYDADFEDPALYAKPWLEGQESNGATFRAVWRDGASLSREGVLVPEGLYGLLRSLSLLECADGSTLFPGVRWATAGRAE